MKRILIYILLLFPVLINAQTIGVKECINSIDHPVIRWYSVGSVDTTEFKVFRADIKSKQYKQINTIHYVTFLENNDTVLFTVIDTTLTKKGIYLYYIEAVRFRKTVRSEIAMGHNYGLLPEPQVTAFNTTPLTDRKAVKLDWEVTLPQMISSLTLYRSRWYDTGYVKIADFSADINTFTDVIPVANEPWFYFLEISNWFGGTTKSVRTPAFATFAEKPIPPQNIYSKFRNDTVFIGWQNVSRNIIGYRVFRSVDGKPFRQLHEMQGGTAENILFTDQDDAVKKAVKLSYFIRNVSDGFVESNSTDTLVFYLPEHKPVLPPNQVDYIQLPNGNLKLLWMPPEKGLVLAYNIYLTDSVNKTVKLNPDPVASNWYTDSVYRGKGKYIYQVEGVGMNNKLSENKAMVTFYRYNPEVHVILNIKKYREGLSVSWKKVPDTHIVKVMLLKQWGNNKPELLKTFTDNIDRDIYDKDVQHGNTYQYLLKGVFENGDAVLLNDGVQIYF